MSLLTQPFRHPQAERPFLRHAIFALLAMLALVGRGCSGPGTVTFANAASPRPSIAFSAAGNYLLRLTGTNTLGDASREPLSYAYNGNQIALVTTSGFAGWINGFPGLTDSTPAGDPDHDGMEKLEQSKLNPLLRLKYHDSITDAVADLGGRPEEIGKVFAGFQKFLYAEKVA